nr:MAG TPA: hydrolase [Bacteriophage sp.]
MYEIVKSVIESGRYELADMLKKIDTLWVQNELTEEQKKELETLARDEAIPENSYAGLQEQIDKLYDSISDVTTAIADITDRVTILEGGEPPVPPEPEEWPEYVQPTGTHDAYNTGDKITYNGQHYICKMDGCVWNPTDYPAGWELATEPTKEESTEQL